MPHLKIAYCVTPKIGGTYNFFRTLCGSIPQSECELFCVATGRQESQRIDPDYVTSNCVSIAPEVTDVKRSAIALRAWLADNDIDIVIPMNSRPALSCIPYLNANTRAIFRCSNTTRYNYEIVTRNREFAAAIACSTPRQVQDLKSRYGVPSQTLHLIPHGIDLKRFCKDTSLEVSAPLRLLYLGRVENRAKGVFLLPRILANIDKRQVHWRLTVIGSGPDFDSLRQKLQKWIEAQKVVMRGNVPGSQIPDEIRNHDILLMPSHFEGFGFSLIEGMAAGCVPVVSHLPGVTDSIVTDDSIGVLCGVGSASGFANAVCELANDSRRLAAMKSNARQAVFGRFSATECGNHWLNLFRQVVSEEGPALRYRSDIENLQPFVTTSPWWFVPRAWRGPLRGTLERFRAARHRLWSS